MSSSAAWPCSATCSSLGARGRSCIRSLPKFIDAAEVDVVYACGEMMRGLYEALPASRRGAYAKTSEQLAPLLTKGVGAGDVVMIKGSFGSRMAPLVEALQRHFQAAGARPLEPDFHGFLRFFPSNERQNLGIGHEFPIPSGTLSP